MKSFKKITAGVCSLVMLSAIATYAVAADPQETVGFSNNSIGDSGNPTVPGDCSGEDPITPGKSEEDPITPGNSENPDNPDNPDNPNNPGDSSKFLLGDANCDGKVLVNDLLLIKKHVLNISKLEGQGLDNSDIDRSGKVIVNDLLFEKKFILKVIKSWDELGL